MCSSRARRYPVPRQLPLSQHVSLYGVSNSSTSWQLRFARASYPCSKVSRTPAGHLPKFDAVGMEHGDRQTIHAERHAARMRRFTRDIPDVPGEAEMVAVIVEAHAGCRLLFGAQRDQQLEFQGLLLLADGLHLTDAAEERIAGIIDLEGQAEIARNRLGTHHPAFTEIRYVIGISDADVFAHPERLQPVEMAGRFAAEAIGRDVKAQAALRQRASACRNRIDRIASRRREHEIGRRERRGPVAAGIEAADRGVDFTLGPVQAANATKQVREALQITGFLQLSAISSPAESASLPCRVRDGG